MESRGNVLSAFSRDSSFRYINMDITVQEYQAPCGTLVLGTAGGTLCMCDWLTEGSERRREALARRFGGRLVKGDSETLAEARFQLDEYFSGKRTGFDLPADMRGTEFQRSVWEALREVEYGSVVSYSRIASRIGRPKAVRAVAGALHANMLSVIIPCHRVIASDGSLTGYAGTLSVKSFLLALERLKQRPEII